jgi:hypothetical protein
MQLFPWIHKRMTGRPQTRRTTQREPPPRFRPQLETLEGRDVPSTLTVTTSAEFSPAGGLGLGDAIQLANSGDTINFSPSLNGQTITLVNQQLEITKNLTIQGPGAGLLAISGNDGAAINPRIFQVDANASVTLSGLTLEDGGGAAEAFYGGGVGWSGNGWDQYGGAILNLGTLTVNACTLSGNSAGSVFYPFGGSQFYGGAIYNAGTLTVNNSTLSGNTAYGHLDSPQPPTDEAFFGGAIDNGNGATLTLNNSTVTGNSAQYGGGIYNSGSAGTLTLNNSTVTGNYAQDGGGIYNTGSLAIDYSTVTNNTATHKGDDLFNLGTFSEVHSKIGQKAS